MCRRQSGAHNFKLPRFLKISRCVTASIYGGDPPSSARIRRRSTGEPHHKLEITCCWPSDLLQRKLCQVLYSLEICLGLTFCSHCILLCIPNSTPVLRVLVASLLSCMGSLLVTERHVWVQHLGWCELVLCSLICELVLCSLICNVSSQFCLVR